MSNFEKCKKVVNHATLAYSKWYPRNKNRSVNHVKLQSVIKTKLKNLMSSYKSNFYYYLPDYSTPMFRIIYQTIIICPIVYQTTPMFPIGCQTITIFPIVYQTTPMFRIIYQTIIIFPIVYRTTPMFPIDCQTIIIFPIVYQTILQCFLLAARQL